MLSCFCTATWGAEITKTDYRGWKSETLHNELVEVTIAPDIGGRVIQYRLGDYEFFWVNPQLAGKQPPPSGLGPDGAWLNYGGDKLWPAPQGWDNDRQWAGPPDAVLDGSPHRCEIVQNAAGKKLIRLTSGRDPRSGIQFSRDITLDERSTRVHVEATMTNIDRRPRRWGIWTVTQQNAVGRGNVGYDKNIRVYCPVNPASKLPDGYRVIFGDAENPSCHLDTRRGLMCVHYQRRVGKIGLDSSAGWVATVHGSAGRVFVQRFQFDATKEYPDGASVEVWLNGVGRFVAWGKVNEVKDDPIATPSLIETELLSPFASLEPGEHSTFAYDWYSTSVGGDFPVLDCNGCGVVCSPLESKLGDERFTLSGRFGVFQEAALRVVFLDEQGKPLDSPAHAPQKVSPLSPVVFSPKDPLPPPPRGAATASLRLFDASDRLIGELTRAELKREQPSD